MAVRNKILSRILKDNKMHCPNNNLNFYSLENSKIYARNFVDFGNIDNTKTNNIHNLKVYDRPFSIQFVYTVSKNKQELFYLSDLIRPSYC